MKPAALLLGSLIALLVHTDSHAASTFVLYETGWEANPASPGWVAGNVSPQNNWQDTGRNGNPGRHRVVLNGSADANPFGTPVVTPTGSQFHRFTASSSTITNNEEWAWPDLSGAFVGRPAGYDLFTGSSDFYVPSGDSGDGSSYGLFGYDDSPDGNFLDFGFLVVPSTRSIRLLLDGVVTATVPAAFAYNTWFNVSIKVDYTSGAVSILVDGVALPDLSGSNTYIIGSSFTDLDLFCQNSKTAPNPRVVYTDNYRVTLDPLAPVLPVLTIAPGAIGEWHISWSAEYFDWILESTQDINATNWTNEGLTPDISGGIASVDLPEAPPRTFYRLRQP